MISISSHLTRQAIPTNLSVATVATPASLAIPVDSWVGTPANLAPDKGERSLVASAMHVFTALGEGALAGYLGSSAGSAIGGILGGLNGASEGAFLGVTAGHVSGTRLAGRACEGKGNAVASGIGALVLPMAGGTIGLIGGATAMAVAGASGNPLLGALVSGGMALGTEIILHRAA